MSNACPDRRAGFTLVETLVAAVVAGMGFAALAGAVGSAARLQSGADTAAKAVIVAESVLAEDLIGAGERDGFGWRVERTDLRAPGATVEGLTLVEVAVTVTTSDGRSQTLRTRRLEGRR
ncbi:MAG: type IV pilus modification PilV family protein [Caulobacterales bacterium]|jgi:prepilin-type N-terminal cleavage/methylation domain-containing protein